MSTETTAPQPTADRENVALFGDLASDWWDPEGRSKLLHRINPTRLQYIHERLVSHFGADRRTRHVLEGRKALDIGCGAGLVTEPLARMGAETWGLDASPEVIEVAKRHADEQGLAISYHTGELAEFATGRAGEFDLVTCLEVIEHVQDRVHFLATIRRILKPGGLLIYSTPNRTALSWLVLIVGAEYVTKSIPKGGHDWRQFLRPEELEAELKEAGFVPGDLDGLSWLPTRGFHIGRDKTINYIGTARPTEKA